MTTDEPGDRRRLRIAFIANLLMFAIGVVGWRVADSTSLLADAFDMLADASGYLVTLMAVGRSIRMQRSAARWNGALLVILGAGVIGEASHRLITGSAPVGVLILAFAALSLAVNGSVLAMLWRYRYSAAVHLRATWTDTRADVVVNVAVLASGAAIAITQYKSLDLIVGALIGAYVIKEGLEIWEMARRSDPPESLRETAR
jgi:cation diffusion facilitator family transporter